MRRGSAKRRSNIFKLGRRGRRGRVAYDTRWGHVIGISNSTQTEDVGSSSAQPDLLQRSNISATNTVAVSSSSYLDRTFSNPGIANIGDKTIEIHDVEENDTIIDHECVENSHRLVQIESQKPDDPANPTVGLLTTAVDNIHSGDTGILEVQDHMSPRKEEEEPAFGDVEVTMGAHPRDIFAPESPEEMLHETLREHQTSTDVPDDMEQSINGDERVVLKEGEILRRFQKISKWQNLLSVILVSGSVRLSVEQFELFRVSFNHLLDRAYPGYSKLPAYSTIERTLKPTLRTWGFVSCNVSHAALDMTKSGATQTRLNEPETGSFIFIKPSAWSQMDVSCHHSWEQLKEASRQVESGASTTAFRHIEETPILRCRETILDANPVFEQISDHYLPTQSTGLDPTNYVYVLHFQQPVALPDRLLNAVQNSRDEEGRVESITVTPLRTFLVTPKTDDCDISKGLQHELEKGTLSILSKEGEHQLWFSRDFCTSLKPEFNVQYLLVVVQHQARPGLFSRRLELLCIPYSLPQPLSRDSPFCALHWNAVIKSVLADMKLARRDAGILPVLISNFQPPVVPSLGKLQGGMRYFVDHILLYSDGFSQYNFKQGSSGGVYGISLNFPPSLRRKRDMVRIMALTPPGISTTEGIRSLLPDLVKSCTEGNIVRNADGEDMLLFLDVVGFVGDYHEVSHILDIVGQNGRAPCHLCSFLRFSGHPSTASSYGYATDVHAGNACYARMGARTKAIRASNISDDDLVSLGLNTRHRARAKGSPIIEIADAINAKLKTINIPLTEHDVPVLNPKIDPYRSIFVAPDHLLAGIAINELNLAFKVLPNPKRRMQANSMICNLLRSNGLKQESRVFNFNTSAMYSTSISGTFCILLVGSTVFKEIIESLATPGELCCSDLDILVTINENLRLFRKLVSRTYWYPERGVDEPFMVRNFNSKQGMEHIASLQDLCVEYIKGCNEICKKNEVAAAELDKPNLHRLLELYQHSIPAAGHVHHFAELVFECAHQPLKKAMAKSNFRESHLQSMNHSIADDWKRRLAAAYAPSDRSPGMKSNITSLVNLLCGRKDGVKNCILQDPSHSKKAELLLQNEVMKGIIGDIPSHLDLQTCRSVWHLTEKANVPICPREIQDLANGFVLEIEVNNPEVYNKARRVKCWGTGKNKSMSHPRGYDTLVRDTAVQVLMCEDDTSSPVLEPCEVSHEELETVPVIHHFAIDSFVHISEELIYACVRKCAKTNEGFLTVKNSTSIQLLKLTDAVRRIGLFHACNEDPSLHCIQTDSPSVNCTASILNGNFFYYFNRDNGYPPRMA